MRESDTSIEAGREMRPAEVPVVGPAGVTVWDRFVRFFHWSLVVLFAAAYLTRETWEQAHVAAGYGVLLLIAARVIWGFVGSRHARFRDFLYSPLGIARFLIDTVLFRAKRYLGHNPAGGAMVIALIVAILVICLSGVAMTLDRLWGIKWIETVHVIATYVTLGLLVLHVLGVLLASIEHRENLTKSMLTGKKRGQ